GVAAGQRRQVQSRQSALLCRAPACLACISPAPSPPMPQTPANPPAAPQPAAPVSPPSRPATLRSAARVVARERLLAQLTEARRRRCIVLQGPAGYRKTALLSAWRLDLLALGFDMAALTLEPAANERPRWVDRVLGCR